MDKYIKSRYTYQNIQEILNVLEAQKTLTFSPLDNGLFPAAKTGKETDYTGYSSIWVRDNIHIAHAHSVLDNYEIALKTINALMCYFKKHKNRFEKIISFQSDPSDPMNRPHIRFNGFNLEEIDQKWAHAQNDALGYFLWFYCKLANQGRLKILDEDLELLLLFPKYWSTIQFWQDEDSGHWEENRKISASSIGVVLAALQELNHYLSNHNQIKMEVIDQIKYLIGMGQQSLDLILPSECIQSDSKKKRRFDSALLFLIYPLGVVTGNMADTILNDVMTNLQGKYGIRRYIGDSYWSADYKKKLEPGARTVDFSDDLSTRDSFLKENEEAQWCIFDPIISVIFGLKYQKTKSEHDFNLQIHYLNRSLGQITGFQSNTGEFLCPESYYLEDGKYVPSDPTPLYWTQANLICALKTMEHSLQ